MALRKALHPEEAAKRLSRRTLAASPAFPRRLGSLGLPEHETRRHIAWDIGIGAVGRQLSRLLDAAVILQTYSRLVIDCNRDPDVPSSIPEISEDTDIPGN